MCNMPGNPYNFESEVQHEKKFDCNYCFGYGGLHGSSRFCRQRLCRHLRLVYCEWLPTKWNGKDNGCLFGLYKGDATWTVKTNKTSPSVNAELMKVVRLFPDQEVARMSTITSSQSKNFVAGDDAGYYAVITASNNRGATGSTYIDQDSSIVG